jgi:3-hydroxymyristoyl/3-hydroxydecanoyl-(acyl carrier protein) dehydratase
MSALHIEPHASYFNGHFPKRPILPGVVELQLVVDHLSQAQGHSLALHAIRFARLRQIVVPGDRLEILATPADDGSTRVDVKRADVVVANAQFQLSADELPAAPTRVAFDGDTVLAPPLDMLLPHRPPMRFIEAIERESSTGLQCRARITNACGLARAGRVPILIALEAAAQAAAAWEALRRARESDGGARIGYLVAIRDAQFYAASVAVDETIITTIQLEDMALPLTHYAVEATVEEHVVLRARIATVLTDERP